MLCELHRTEEGIENDTLPCPPCVERAKAQAERDALAFFRYKQEQAGIPRRYWKATLDSIIVETEAQAEILQVAQRFVESGGQTPSGLVEIGTLGSGKTHLASAIGNASLQARRSVAYFTALGLVRRLRSTWHSKTESEEAVFNKIVKTDLVIIDEVGVQAGSPSELAMVTNLIDARYANRKPTILIGNLTIQELTSTLGERVIDRFKQGGKVLVFTWPSRRPSFLDEAGEPEEPVWRPSVT